MDRGLLIRYAKEYRLPRAVYLNVKLPSGRVVSGELSDAVLSWRDMLRYWYSQDPDRLVGNYKDRTVRDQVEIDDRDLDFMGNWCAEHMGDPYGQKVIVTPEVFTFGYGGKNIDQVFASLKSVRGYLIDIRENPYSQIPAYRKANLEQKFGRRYQHWGEWGNVGRKDGKIQIASLECGMERLQDCLNRNIYPLALMCGCKDFHTCHRGFIAKELLNRGIETCELPV